MSARGEKTFIAHLVDPDSLKVITQEGVKQYLLPTPELHPVYEFAMHYYFKSDCLQAPSVDLIREHFGDLLDDHEIDIVREPEDSINWAIEDLKGSHAHGKAAEFAKNLVIEMSEAPPQDRVNVIKEAAAELVGLSIDLDSGAQRINMVEDIREVERQYRAREALLGQPDGLLLGIPEIDAVTSGIRDGELAVMAAGPKMGKSFIQCYVALRAWQKGRRVALFTLENSVDLMRSRIACMACTVDTTKWDQGLCTPEEVERVLGWIAEVEEGERDGTLPPLYILKPDIGERSFEQMVREAQIRDAEDLLIDQLTFVEVGDGPSDRRAKTDKIGASLHRLHGMISSGSHQIPCFLTHQVNREGVQAADKLGRLELNHMADSAEVERTADFIFGLYASEDDRIARQAKFQMLGSRRTPFKHWELQFRPEIGAIRARSEISLT